MNNDTIKAAEEYAKERPFWAATESAFLAGAEYRDSKCEEAIRVAVEYAVNEKDDVIAIMQRVIEGQKKDKNVMEQQINQLVEFIEEIKSYLGPHTTDRANELIQKHRP